MPAGKPGLMRAIRDNSLHHQSGYTLIVVVVLVALASIGMYRVATTLSLQKQRDQEQMLLRIGNMYAQALQHYVESAPGSLKQYPTDLKQLVLDTRFVGVARHMRQVYPDPMQPALAWGLVKNQAGGIIGVYSTSELRPLLQSGEAPVAHAQHYADWKFLAKDNK